MLATQTYCKKVFCVGVRCVVTGTRTVRPLLFGETVTVENYRNVLTAGTEWTVLVVVEQAAMCDRTVWRGLGPPWPPDLRHLTYISVGISQRKRIKRHFQSLIPNRPIKQQSPCPDTQQPISYYIIHSSPYIFLVNKTV